MPRTWSYRKRDYEITKPVVKGFSPQIMGLVILYTLICGALITGMTYALTHKMKDSDTPPPIHDVGHNGQAPLD